MARREEPGADPAYSQAWRMAVHDQLVQEKAELLAALKLAVRYLEHPDVQAMNFALSAEVAAKRARAAIEAAEGTE